jgi:hypothetical protein
MRANFKGIASVVFVVLFGLSACNLGAQPPQQVTPVATDIPPLDVPVEATEPPVQHVMVPGDLPAVRSGLAGDHDSSSTAAEQRAPGGDRFTFGRYERPFNAGTMDVYFPYLDILISEFYQDDTWMYAVISVKGDEAGGTPDGKYGFEIDLDVDGGGDWLVMAHQPASTEWTTDGVRVWFDENDDVGGAVKVAADNSSSFGDGYETMVFGSGQGDDDPDLAWVRISPDDPNTIQFAVKRSLLGGDTAFMVGMWSGNDDFDPALFDVNDTLTHEQAGASLKELEFFYPVKELSELDNACRMAIGFNATGIEPGVCPVPAAPGNPGDDPSIPPPPPPPGLTCPPPAIIFCNNDGSCYCLEPAG